MITAGVPERASALAPAGERCDDCPMPDAAFLPRLRRAALYILAVTLSAGVGYAPALLAQDITPFELRHMSAAQFQHHLDTEGVQRFVTRMRKDLDPHSPEEPNYDIVLEHIAEGSNGWIRIAGEIAPYTDATFSEGLRVALADALVENPAGVLRFIGSEEHFDQACGYPFVRQTDHYLRQHQKAALAALNRVRTPALAEKKEACRKQLLDLPTSSATAAP